MDDQYLSKMTVEDVVSQVMFFFCISFGIVTVLRHQRVVFFRISDALIASLRLPLHLLTVRK